MKSEESFGIGLSNSLIIKMCICLADTMPFSRLTGVGLLNF